MTAAVPGAPAPASPIMPPSPVAACSSLRPRRTMPGPAPSGRRHRPAPPRRQGRAGDRRPVFPAERGDQGRASAPDRGQPRTSTTPGSRRSRLCGRSGRELPDKGSGNPGGEERDVVRAALERWLSHGPRPPAGGSRARRRPGWAASAPRPPSPRPGKPARPRSDVGSPTLRRIRRALDERAGRASGGAGPRGRPIWSRATAQPTAARSRRAVSSA